LVGLEVIDCAGSAVTGATISVKQGSTAVGTAVDASMFIPGTTLYYNVPPSDGTEISATYDGITFLSHTVKSVADATTTTVLAPGYE
jgi:hypothetical protein